MSAYLELRETGRMGEDGVRLLYSTVRKVGRRFPPPSGGRWDDDKYIEVAHDFLTRPSSPMSALFAWASDDSSLERLLAAAVLNHFRSVSRRSERAKLLRRLNDVLARDARFVEAGKAGSPSRRWALRGLQDNDEYTGDPRPLRRAAWEAQGIAVARWRSSTRTYVSDRESIAAFALAVLAAAGGPVDRELLLDIAADRFDLREPPLTIDIDDVPVEGAVATPSDEATPVAEEVWRQLTERERAALPFLDGTVREAAEALGVGKTTAADVLRRLKALLADTAGMDGAVLRRLQELAMVRTPPNDRSSQ